MSRTLFWYVFKDLMRVFFMASGAIAGIMSFGALLRPLTQNGLDSSQVVKLLSYFMPAMSTYSLPIAAVFSTTIVYGRMSADNEITACRASGISMGLFGVALPAVLFGMVVASISLVALCFTVPSFTMKIERTLYSNLAKLVAHEIEQKHETPFGRYTVFALNAYLPATPPDSGTQAVVLQGPLIVTYATPRKFEPFFQVPREFWLAKEATLFVKEDPEDGSASLTATLRGGLVFPRSFALPKTQQGGMEVAEFGPVEIPSRLGEKPKFMTITQLKALEKTPTSGREVRRVAAEFIQQDQANVFTRALADALNGPTIRCEIRNGADRIVIQRTAGQASVQQNEIVMTSSALSHEPPLLFRQEVGGRSQLTAEARTIRITVAANTKQSQLTVAVNLRDTLVDAGDTPSPQAELTRSVTLPMPDEIAAMQNRTAQQYLDGQFVAEGIRSIKDLNRLRFALRDLTNHLYSEMHARAAFVVSCLFLVLVGACLGMMFRSGNFLTAFAVSVIPAMLSVVLIVTGQHTTESVPGWVTPTNNPLNVGLGIIWSGDVLVALGAITLLWRLERQ